MDARLNKILGWRTFNHLAMMERMVPESENDWIECKVHWHTWNWLRNVWYLTSLGENPDKRECSKIEERESWLSLARMGQLALYRKMATFSIASESKCEKNIK